MPRRKQLLTGAKRMQQLGRKPVQLWLTPKELSLVRRIAKLQRRPMSNFILNAALRAAEEAAKEEKLLLHTR